MKHDREGRGILDDLTAPQPPAQMRARVLAAARRTAALPPSVSAWRAVAALFVAQPRWTAALAAVLLAHLILGVFEDRTGSPRPSLPRDVEVQAQPEILRLPRIEDAGLGRFAARLEGPAGSTGDRS